jgi:tetratricopeptide (TPR) repeat protein
MKERSFCRARAVTSNRTLSRRFLSSLKHATKTQVNVCFSKLIELAAAFHYRGRCYQGMGDFQRALYDFTLAIKLDNQNQAKPQDIAEHYSKMVRI